MKFKDLPIRTQIANAIDLRNKFIKLSVEVNLLREEFRSFPDEQMPPLDAIIKELKLAYADIKLDEEKAQVNP